jgi:hypothetical protein
MAFRHILRNFAEEAKKPPTPEPVVIEQEVAPEPPVSMPAPVDVVLAETALVPEEPTVAEVVETTAVTVEPEEQKNELSSEEPDASNLSKKKRKLTKNEGNPA